MTGARGRAARPRLAVPAEVTRAQLEQLTGYSSKQLTRWVQSTDIPHRRDANELFFPWPAVRAWINRYLEDKGRRAAAPINAKNARDREDAAREELLEIDLAKARGEVMKVEDGERWLADAFSRARARLANLAPRVAAAAFGSATIQEAQARVQPVVDEVFEELRRTDDINSDDDTADDTADDAGD